MIPNRIFRDACETAEVPSEGRPFYAIRYSLRTYLTREGLVPLSRCLTAKC